MLRVIQFLVLLFWYIIMSTYFSRIEYKAGKSIPSEVMTQLEELPVIPPYSRVYIIGLSQSSARMRRLGQVPIAKFGVKIVLSQQDGGRESRTQEKVENVKTHFSTDEQPQSVRIKQNVVDPNNHANATVTALDRFLARYNTNVVENLASTYKRSCYRLMLSMSKVYDRVTDKFPEKMYR